MERGEAPKESNQTKQKDKHSNIRAWIEATREEDQLKK